MRPGIMRAWLRAGIVGDFDMRKFCLLVGFGLVVGLESMYDGTLGSGLIRMNGIVDDDVMLRIVSIQDRKAVFSAVVGKVAATRAIFFFFFGLEYYATYTIDQRLAKNIN